MAFRINVANASDLARCLPGIGPKRAETLVELRDRLGYITPETLAYVLKKSPDQEYLSSIDFSIPKSSEVRHAGKVTEASSSVTDVGQGARDDFLSQPLPNLPDPLLPTKVEDMRSDRNLFVDLWPKVPDYPLPSKGSASNITADVFKSTFGSGFKSIPSLDVGGEKSDEEREDVNPEITESLEGMFKELEVTPNKFSPEWMRHQLIEHHKYQLELLQRQMESYKEPSRSGKERRTRHESRGHRESSKSPTTSKSRKERPRSRSQTPSRPRKETSRSPTLSKFHREGSRSTSPSRSCKEKSRSPRPSRSRTAKQMSRSPSLVRSRKEKSRRKSRSRSKRMDDLSSSRSPSPVKSPKGRRRRSYSRSQSRSPSRYSRSQRRSSQLKDKSGRRQHRASTYFESSSSNDSDNDDYGASSSGHRGNPKRLPKNLTFNGNSNWLSFKRKFESYRSVLRWTEAESKDYLSWCLEGKALDFFSIVTQEGEDYSFRKLMRMLEGRFGDMELTETSKAKFHQATQGQEETLEDWADRVLTLATPAIKDLPEKYSRKEVITKFCQGCWDRDAGKHVCLEKPRSIRQALDAVKHFQYISQAVDKKKKKEDRYSVNAVAGSSESEQLEEIKKALGDIHKALDRSAAKSPGSSKDKTDKRRLI